MSKQLPRVVADTCVILNVLVQNDTDKPEWLNNGKWVLEAHGDSHDVFLPAIVLAELGGCPYVRGEHIPFPERYQRVKKVADWLAGNRFQTIDIDERVGLEAARLAVKFQLKGPDAAVLASAVIWNIPTLYTWDQGLLKIGMSLPGVTVKEPKRPLS